MESSGVTAICKSAAVVATEPILNSPSCKAWASNKGSGYFRSAAVIMRHHEATGNHSRDLLGLVCSMTTATESGDSLVWTRAVWEGLKAIQGTPESAN